MRNMLKAKATAAWSAPPIFPTYNLPLGAPLKVLKFTFTIATGVHGGDEWELLQDVHAGDTLTPRGKIINLVEREGKKGRMLFVTSEVTFMNRARRSCCHIQANGNIHSSAGEVEEVDKNESQSIL